MRLIILGAGGYGQTVADVARQLERYEDNLFLDDNAPAVGTCADFERFAEHETAFYPAFGNNEVRMKWLNALRDAGCTIATLVHPAVYVSPTATLEPGTVVLPMAVVNTNCAIRRGCIINCGAIVDHGCVLEEGVHICLGAIVKAENRIPRCMKIEAGQVIENRTYPL